MRCFCGAVSLTPRTASAGYAWEGYADGTGRRHAATACDPPPQDTEAGERYEVRVQVLRSSRRADPAVGGERYPIRTTTVEHPTAESATRAYERALREARRHIEETAL